MKDLVTKNSRVGQEAAVGTLPGAHAPAVDRGHATVWGCLVPPGTGNRCTGRYVMKRSLPPWRCWSRGARARGFWTCRKLLRRQGRPWNHKRIYRVYKLMRLHLRRRAKQRLPSGYACRFTCQAAVYGMVGGFYERCAGRWDGNSVHPARQAQSECLCRAFQPDLPR
jgi:hypothetical protein